MKTSLAFALSQIGLVGAFAPSSFGVRKATTLNAASIWYSTSTGNTETCAGYIAEAAGCDANEIGDASDSDITGSDCLIVGAPTWHTDADEQRSGTSWDGMYISNQYERL